MIIKNDCFSLEQIADSGQCFRMNKTSDGKYTVAAFGKVLYLSQRENEITFECSEEDYKQIWEKYFDIEDVFIKSENISSSLFPLNSGAYKSALESINTGIPLNNI